MNRPKITAEMVKGCVSEIADDINVDAETIAAAFSPHMDGYQLARELERYHWVDGLTMPDVERLDEVAELVDDALRKAEMAWVIENHITPKLCEGDVIDRGVIAGVCKHSPARYLVKEHGCTQAGLFLLLKFEDAEKHSPKGRDVND